MRGISLNSDQIASQNLASAPLSTIASYTHRYKLDQVLINFSQAISETVTVTLISMHGTNYNVVLDSVLLANDTSYVFRPQGECNLQTGDMIQVQCTNNNGVGIAYCTIKTMQLGSGG